MFVGVAILIHLISRYVVLDEWIRSNVDRLWTEPFALELSAVFIIAGQQLCGRVDDVPGTCYVVTRFMHLYYIPLIPLSSWLVPYGTESKAEAEWLRIRLSAKSILVGWLQGFLVLFGLLNLGWGAVRMYAPRGAVANATNGVMNLMLGVSCLVAFLLFTIRPLRAGQVRANELRARLGLEVEAVEEHFDFPTD
ncbi:hypothetical protein [Schlesneria paludicola]|uniref:hypothetical protein n=1 Tax=Schlesneria paludicola TaxID=360056 RepID=UPI00029A283C|nr:hypothetical protein [Schlesneria paludicola]